MSVNQSSTVVGVFRDRALADQAMDALFNAGFDRSQIRYAGPGTSGSFLEDIKNLFTGPSTGGGSIVNDLTGMGLSDEEAQYYSNEYGNGNTVVAVKAPGREQEAMNILQGFKAYNYAAAASTAHYAAQQPSDYVQQPASTPQNSYSGTDEHTVTHEPGTAYQGSERPADATANNYERDAQPDTVTATNDQPARDISDVPTQIVRQSDTNVPEQQTYTAPDDYTQDPQRDVAAPTSEQAYTTTDEEPPRAAQADVVTPASAQAYTATDEEAPRAAQSDVVTPASAQVSTAPNDYHQDAVSPAAQDYTTAPDRTPDDIQPDVAPAVDNPNYPATNDYQQDAVTPVSDQQAYPAASSGLPATPQPVPEAGTTQHTELEDFQAQIQTIQQQLQDTQAQLQAAKDRETQLRTVREERENSLRESRQQLQDLQGQLQAAQAELRETQGRIDQYQ